MRITPPFWKQEKWWSSSTGVTAPSRGLSRKNDPLQTNYIGNETKTPGVAPSDSRWTDNQAIAQTIEDVHAKRLSAKTAAGVAPLFNTLLRTIQTQDLENKVNALEQQLLKLSTDHSEEKRAEPGSAAFAGTGEHPI
jgi:hypothetical protein